MSAYLPIYRVMGDRVFRITEREVQAQVAMYPDEGGEVIRTVADQDDRGALSSHTSPCRLPCARNDHFRGFPDPDSGRLVHKVARSAQSRRPRGPPPRARGTRHIRRTRGACAPRRPSPLAPAHGRARRRSRRPRPGLCCRCPPMTPSSPHASTPTALTLLPCPRIPRPPVT